MVLSVGDRVVISLNHLRKQARVYKPYREDVTIVVVALVLAALVGIALTKLIAAQWT